MFDTNMCIYLMKRQPPAVAAHFAACHVGDVVMSSITFAELEYGLSVCADPKRERQVLDVLAEMIEVRPFDLRAAHAYGPVRYATRNRKTDHLDKLIAAHCIALGAVLVTNNEKDFAHYPGLEMENWL
jgi:tRNA(fMet)-specific endonuclease VapC